MAGEKTREIRTWLLDEIKRGAFDRNTPLPGDLELAEQIAAEKAGIENYSLIAYPEKDSPLALLKDAVKEDYIDAHVTSTLGQWADDLMFLGNLNTMDHIQARMPYAIHIVD